MFVRWYDSVGLRDLNLADFFKNISPEMCSIFQILHCCVLVYGIPIVVCMTILRRVVNTLDAKLNQKKVSCQHTEDICFFIF